MDKTRIQDELIDILRAEFNREEEWQGEKEYQWVMGISIKLEPEGLSLLRVVVKTSESPYVDGMEIGFMVIDGLIELGPSYYENSPDLMGSSVDTSIKWLSELGEIIYLQRENPYADTDDILG